VKVNIFGDTASPTPQIIKGEFGALMAEHSGKKRKRQSNGLDVPNKKAALDSEHVKVSFADGNGLAPVLVSSPGLNTPDISFEGYAKAHSTRHTQRLPRPTTHDLLLHSQQHPRLDYTASSVSLDQGLSHYVAVYDPATKQLRISPAHHLSLRSTLRSQPKSEDRKQRTALQQRQELGREFGTKKAKKAIADKTVNAIVNRDPNGKSKKDDVQDAILQSMPDTSATALTEDQALEASLESKPIPRPNLAAEEVEEVYPFNTLVPPADARMLDVSEWQEKAQNEEKVNFQHRFIAYRMNSLSLSDEIDRLKALRYLQLLLEFHSALAPAGKTGKKVPKKDVLARRLAAWPDTLVSSVRRRFANEANELPKWHLQRLYTHMCALTLFVDGWVTDTTNLKDDLNMEVKEIVQYFRELGCRISAPTEAERERWGIKKGMEKGVKVAKLKSPLDFPKARGARRR
jgi:DNA-directed RNA polymerase I subunit RPA49